MDGLPRLLTLFADKSLFTIVVNRFTCDCPYFGAHGIQIVSDAITVFVVFSVPSFVHDNHYASHEIKFWEF